MQWSDISFSESPKKMRQFAGLWLIVFGLLAWRGFAQDRPILGMILATLAVSVGVAGMLWPRLVRPIYGTWMILAFPIGWTVSHVLLAIVYFGVVTPTALVFKLIGRDALARKQQSVKPTYWEAKPTAAAVSSYFRQF